MTKQDIVQAFSSCSNTILLYSKELREWAAMLIPALITWHLKQPPWMKKKKDEQSSKSEP